MSFYRGIVDDVKNRAVDGIGKFPKIMFVRNDMPVYQKRRKRRGTERWCKCLSLFFSLYTYTRLHDIRNDFKNFFRYVNFLQFLDKNLDRKGRFSVI